MHGDPHLVPGPRYIDQSSSYSGRFNKLMDSLSRLDRPFKTEWPLNKWAENSIFQMLNYPSVDLFATRCNQTPIVCITSSGQPFLSNKRIADELNCLHAYAFTPTILKPSVLAKIRQSQCRIVPIAPLWPQRPWFSEVLQI